MDGKTREWKKYIQFLQITRGRAKKTVKRDAGWTLNQALDQGGNEMIAPYRMPIYFRQQGNDPGSGLIESDDKDPFRWRQFEPAVSYINMVPEWRPLKIWGPHDLEYYGRLRHSTIIYISLLAEGQRVYEWECRQRYCTI